MLLKCILPSTGLQRPVWDHEKSRWVECIIVRYEMMCKYLTCFPGRLSSGILKKKYHNVTFIKL